MKSIEFKILAVLEDIQRSGPAARIHGICPNVIKALERTHGPAHVLGNALDELFKAWPHYSGNPTFPISGGGWHAPGAMYHFAKDKWDMATEYGKARHNLLVFSISKLRAKRHIHEHLLQKLKRLKRDGPRHKGVGICAHIYSNLEEQELMADTWKQWQHFSGDLGHPVCDEDGNCVSSYNFGVTHWDKSTVYGRRRHELLNYLIETLETAML